MCIGNAIELIGLYKETFTIFKYVCINYNINIHVLVYTMCVCGEHVYSLHQSHHNSAHLITGRTCMQWSLNVHLLSQQCKRGMFMECLHELEAVL